MDELGRSYEWMWEDTWVFCEQTHSFLTHSLALMHESSHTRLLWDHSYEGDFRKSEWVRNEWVCVNPHSRLVWDHSYEGVFSQKTFSSQKTHEFSVSTLIHFSLLALMNQSSHTRLLWDHFYEWDFAKLLNLNYSITLMNESSHRRLLWDHSYEWVFCEKTHSFLTHSLLYEWAFMNPHRRRVWDHSYERFFSHKTSLLPKQTHGSPLFGMNSHTHTRTHIYGSVMLHTWMRRGWMSCGTRIWMSRVAEGTWYAGIENKRVMSHAYGWVLKWMSLLAQGT